MSMQLNITDNDSILEYQKKNLIGNKHVHNLLKITKGIVLDNKVFKRYTESHLSLTQEHTFKLPEITNYPLMKNEKIVALTNRDKMRENTSSYRVYNRNRLESFEALRKDFQKNSNQLFKTLTMNGNYHKQKTAVNTSKNLLKKLMSAGSERMDYIIDKNLNNAENIFDMNLIFDQEMNMNQFNMEKEIFNKFNDKEEFEEITNFLIKKIKDVIDMRNENITTVLTKSFVSNYRNSDYDIELKCKSLFIKLIPKDNSDSEKFQTINFNLPFTILPIFYFVDNFTFKIFLSKILKFDSEFKQISIDLENFYDNMQELSNLILNNNEMHKESVLLRRSKKGIIEIDWITPNCVYEMSVYPPIVEFKIQLQQEMNYNFQENKFDDDSNSHDVCSFRKYIDKEVLIYILQNDFAEWDFNLINYIVRFKNFRNIVKEFLNESKKNSKILQDKPTGQIPSNKFKFDLDKISSDSVGNLSLSSLASHSTNNLKSQNYFNKNLQNSFEYLTSFPDKIDTVNTYQKISPYSIEVLLHSCGVKTEFIFTINFFYMIYLDLMRKLPLPQYEDYIRMIVIIDPIRKLAELRYKALDSIKDILARRIKFGNMQMEDITSVNVFENFVANCQSQIIINAPVITLYKLEGKKIEKVSRELSQKLTERLNKSEMCLWSKSLMENYEELNFEEGKLEEQFMKKPTKVINSLDEKQRIARTGTMRLNNLSAKK